MTLPGPRHLLCCAALAAAAAAAADCHESTLPESPSLPAWQVLEYEQQAFLVTARSRLELAADGDKPGQWRLQADSSVASNSEQVELLLNAQDGRAVYRSRLSQGRDRRYKTYDFLPQYILRQRFDPAKGSELPPQEWPLSSSREVAYPASLPAETPVTDGYALLELAGRFLASGGDSLEVAINTEFNFYLVKMTAVPTPAIEVSYRQAGLDQPVAGTRETRGVGLKISPLAEPEKPDFSLLGLYGDITILFDRDGELPLQLRGTAPRVGAAEINLKAVTPREAAGRPPGA